MQLYWYILNNVHWHGNCAFAKVWTKHTALTICKVKECLRSNITDILCCRKMKKLRKKYISSFYPVSFWSVGGFEVSRRCLDDLQCVQSSASNMMIFSKKKGVKLLQSKRSLVGHNNNKIKIDFAHDFSIHIFPLFYNRKVKKHLKVQFSIFNKPILQWLLLYAKQRADGTE